MENWLAADLAKANANRAAVPWIIALAHKAWCAFNAAHAAPARCARTSAASGGGGGASGSPGGVAATLTNP
jgi:hypothetical protein